MFPKELLGLPQETKIDFAIDLIPSIASISLSPYMDSLIELQELKT